MCLENVELSYALILTNRHATTSRHANIIRMLPWHKGVELGYCSRLPSKGGAQSAVRSALGPRDVVQRRSYQVELLLKVLALVVEERAEQGLIGGVVQCDGRVPQWQG